MRAAVLIAAVVLTALCLGCGSANAPCEVDISTVDAARSEAERAQRNVEEAKRQKAELEQQLEAEKTRREELERRKAELLAQIEDLGG
jgi:septal ring factor EnvC (AmiA/AmiB activator)